MAMAPRTVLLLLAVLGAAVCLPAVWADEAVTTTSTEDANLVDKAFEVHPSFATVTIPSMTGGVVDGESFDGGSPHEEDASGEPVDVEGGEVESSEGAAAAGVHEPADADAVVDAANAEGKVFFPGRPRARILTSGSSMYCWSVKTCTKFYKEPGCCRETCVNLATDNSNCGKCGNCCDTKKGYCCNSGQCKKPTPPSTQCGKLKKCPDGETCCKAKCVNLKTNNSNCGKCDTCCGYGTICCNGKCTSVKQDDRNCGACGKSCGYGQKCCNGCCKNVFGSDKANCGACGKKCHTTCKFGMCGYGH